MSNIKDIMDNIKIEDFESGMSQEEKFNLTKDLTSIHYVVENHDRSLFQLIAGFNVIQKILIEKGIIDEKEFADKIKQEVIKLENIFLQKVAEMDKE